MDEIKGIRIVSLTGEKEYGIEDSEVREELANVVDGAPEELDSFKEAFEKFKEGGEALAGIADEVAAVGKAVADEVTRAKEAEKIIDGKLDDEIERSVAADQDLLRGIDEEARRATQAEGEINQNTIAADSLGCSTTTDDISLEYETLDGQSTGSVTIPAATTEKAGVMSAEDKVTLNKATTAIKANADAIAMLYPIDDENSTDIHNFICKVGVIGTIPITNPVGTTMRLQFSGGSATFERIIVYKEKPGGSQLIDSVVLGVEYSYTVDGNTTQLVIYGHGNSEQFSGELTLTIDYLKPKSVLGEKISNLEVTLNGNSDTQEGSLAKEISDIKFVKWGDININIPAGTDTEVTINTSVLPSRIVFYENAAGTNMKDMPVENGVAKFTPREDISKIVVYGTATVVGRVEIGMYYNNSVPGLTTDVANLQHQVEDLQNLVGENDFILSDAKNAHISTLSYVRWFVFPIEAHAGSNVSINISTDTLPTRIIAYENETVGAKQHELNVSGTTEFIVRENLTQLLIYGIATQEGDATVQLNTVINGSGLLGDVQRLIENNTSPLYGKKFAFLGSSITQNKKWCALVANKFGGNFINCGVGGSAIVNENDASLSNPKRLTGEYSNIIDPNTGSVTSNGVALPEDSEVIIIEGGVNDWARNWPLGNKKLVFNDDGSLNVDDKTFYGACHVALKNIINRCPNATIIVVGDVFGKMPNRSVFVDKYGLYNNENLLITDYADAFVDVAGMWGCRAFNFGRFVGVNDTNVMSMGDGLHPNENHNKRIANAICNFLQQIHNEEFIEI